MRASAQRWLQRLDRAVGPWLCRAMPPMARGGRNEPVKSLHKILLVRPGGIGDAALSFPMIKALLSVYPHAIIDVLAEKRNAGVYRVNSLVRAAYCYDRQAVMTLSHLIHEQYEAIVDMEQYHH